MSWFTLWLGGRTAGRSVGWMYKGEKNRDRSVGCSCAKVKRENKGVEQEDGLVRGRKEKSSGRLVVRLKRRLKGRRDVTYINELDLTTSWLACLPWYE